MRKGFSVIEIVITMAIFLTLLGLVSLTLLSSQHKASLSVTVDEFISDLRQQQIKAMAGDTEGRATTDDYGIFFNNTSYVFFHNTYNSLDPTNFTVSPGGTLQFSTTFPSSQVIFQKGSGEIVNFDSANNTITIQDTTEGKQKILTLNRYGVITGIQ